MAPSNDIWQRVPTFDRDGARYHWLVEHELLPGNDLIRSGIEDLARGVESIPALLVAIGAPRL